MSTGIARYGSSHSSSITRILCPFGVGHEYTSIIALGPRARAPVAPGAHSSGSNAAMLGGLKGFFANQGLGPDFAEIAAWAQRRGLSFKRERDGHGFVIDGSLDGQPWRLEWG